MLVIAVTGGIGSGKSTVAELFRAKGIPVIDTDVIARKLVEPGSPLLQKIIAQFGTAYLNTKGELNRRALRNLIFSDATARETLENLMHPSIHDAVVNQLATLEAPYCLVLIPLLARAKQRYPHDRILVIDTPESIQVERTAQRDQQSPEMIKQIIASQTPRSSLLNMADDILDNSGDLAALSLAVDKLHEQYLRMAEAKSESLRKQ